VASSRAKPLIEPLTMPSRTHLIANEWGLTPSSSTAALMLKRAEKMKWNVERKHKREQMGEQLLSISFDLTYHCMYVCMYVCMLDALQRLEVARQNEQTPGSLRLAKRQSMIPTTKSPAQKPSTT
jgi:hypothetical protein